MRLEPEILRPHQKKILKGLWDSIYSGSYLMIYGGVGTLKSSTLIFGLYTYLKYLSQFYVNLYVYVCALNAPQLQKTFTLPWAEQVPQDEWGFTDGHTTIYLRDTGVPGEPLSRTQLWLRHTGDFKEGASADRATQGLRGPSAIGFYFPQAESVPFSFYRMMVTRTRGAPKRRPGMSSYPPYKIKIFDANPDSQDHWLKKVFLDSGSDSLAHRTISQAYKTTPQTSIFTQREIDEMRKTMPEFEQRRLLDAEWVYGAGAAYYLAKDNFSTEPLSHGEWYLSFDFGYNDDFVCTLIQSNGYHIWVREEVNLVKTHKPEQEKAVLALLKRHPDKKIVGITGDFSGRYMLAEGHSYSALGYYRDILRVPLWKTDKSRELGWRRLSEWLQTTENGRRLLTLHPTDTPRSQQSFGSMRWNVAGDDMMPGDDHNVDTVRYFSMCRIMRVQPISQRSYKNGEKQFNTA